MGSALVYRSRVRLSVVRRRAASPSSLPPSASLLSPYCLLLTAFSIFLSPHCCLMGFSRLAYLFYLSFSCLSGALAFVYLLLPISALHPPSSILLFPPSLLLTPLSFLSALLSFHGVFFSFFVLFFLLSPYLLIIGECGRRKNEKK